MAVLPHTQESILTPEYARSIVRLVASSLMLPVLEDLAQEALLKGVRAFKRSRVEHPSAFFIKIVRDTVCDHWRRERVWLPLEAIDPRRHYYAPHVEEQLDRGRRMKQIQRALKRLSPREREILYLFYVEEFSLVQLSVMLGKSRSGLKMTLLRARNKIRKAIQEGRIHV